MLPRKVISKLTTIGDVVPYANAGGCGYIAYALYNHIKRNYPDLKPKIVYLVDDEDKEYLQDKVPVSCYHAVVEVNGKYYDANGRHHPQQGYYRVPITKTLARKTLDEGCWNWSFSVSSVATINKILGTRIRYRHRL